MRTTPPTKNGDAPPPTYSIIQQAFSKSQLCRGLTSVPVLSQTKQHAPLLVVPFRRVNICSINDLEHYWLIVPYAMSDIVFNTPCIYYVPHNMHPSAHPSAHSSWCPAFRWLVGHMIRRRTLVTHEKC